MIEYEKVDCNNCKYQDSFHKLYCRYTELNSMYPFPKAPILYDRFNSRGECGYFQLKLRKYLMLKIKKLIKKGTK